MNICCEYHVHKNPFVCCTCTVLYFGVDLGVTVLLSDLPLIRPDFFRYGQVVYRDDAFVSIQMQGLVQIENLLSVTRILLWRSEERLSLTIVSASRVETLRLNSVCELRILGLIQESVLPQVRVLAGIEI